MSACECVPSKTSRSLGPEVIASWHGCWKPNRPLANVAMLLTITSSLQVLVYNSLSRKTTLKFSMKKILDSIMQNRNSFVCIILKIEIFTYYIWKPFILHNRSTHNNVAYRNIKMCLVLSEHENFKLKVSRYHSCIQAYM